MIYDSKEVYEIYKNLVHILKEIKRNPDSVQDNQNLTTHIKNLLGRLYILSYELSMMDICMEIDRIKKSINSNDEKISMAELINCMQRCKAYLEINLLKRSSIILYSRNIQDFEGIIRQLQKDGFNVLVESTGDNMVETISLTSPDLIIIDNDFTNNGLTFYKIINDEGTIRQIPTIFTGPPDKEAKINALMLGALDYIERPFMTEELLIKTRNITRLIRISMRKNIYEIAMGVCSRKYGEEIAEKAFEESINKKKLFSLLLINMDNMAQINIGLGKGCGNQIIKECVEIFKKCLTSKNIIYRHAGDEFILIFPGKEPTEVLDLAVNMQKDVSSLSEKFGSSINFTGGIACSTSHTQSYSDVLLLARDCVKKGKSDGKGLIYIHSTSLEISNKKSILIVDDDRIILSILTARYKNKGYEVYSAENGEEAVEIFKTRNIDLIITDYFMPGMSGHEVIRNIRQINKRVKILVLSAQKTETYVDNALKAGADDYIAKPFSPVELDLRIERFLS